jgi:hypothetical protein
MTDTPTTAPAILSREEIEGLRVWAKDDTVICGSETMKPLCATALAAYDPSGKLWSERAREAEEQYQNAFNDGYAQGSFDKAQEEDTELARLRENHKGEVLKKREAGRYRDEFKARAKAAEARCETIRKALEPFARAIADLDSYECAGSDYAAITSGRVSDSGDLIDIAFVTVGDFRRARAALQEQT